MTTSTRAPTRAGNGGRAAHRTADDSWYDHEAERHLIADLLTLPHHIPTAITTIDPGDLSAGLGNALAAIYDAHRDGDPRIDIHQLARIDGVPDHLAQLLAGYGTGAWRRYARDLTELAHMRRVHETASELLLATRNRDDTTVTDVTARLAVLDRQHHATSDPPGEAVDVDELLASTEPDFDWLVPGLLERRDRVIVTGGEGKGKSTLLRQIAMRVACGLDPFTDIPITPVRVLYVDVENSRRQIRRHVRYLRDIAAGAYVTGNLRFEFRPNLDLLDLHDVAWLDQLVERNHPELVVIGPLYKLAAGDPIKEETARAVAWAIDDIRSRHDSAFLLEAHTPYPDGPKNKRPIRPYGASLWSRWPEFGICLTDAGDLEHWRGPRDMRSWPEALERGTKWPWIVKEHAAVEEDWHGPTECAEAIVAVLTESPGREFSVRQLTDSLRAKGRSFRDSTIRQAAEMAATDDRVESRTGPRNSRLYKAIDTTQETFDADF